jgi:serine phosphatase RsbU (regulator of sigma subunit)
MPDKPTSFDPMENERLAIIQGIAHQTAIAIENIRLLETQQQETYISAALLQVAQTVVSHNEMKDLFASIVQITPILVGSEICLIYIWEPDDEIFHLVESNGIKWQILEEADQTEVAANQFPLLDLIRKQDRMCVLPICGDDPDSPLCWAKIEIPEGAASFNFELNNDPLLVGMPLSVKGEVYGVLLVKDPGTEKMYIQKRLEILTGIAQQTALAIQNDRLQSMVVVRERLEREFQIAREIQQTFLPSEMPEHPGWKMDVRWRPAREVGGDFYDVFPLPDQQLAILVADVTDKGMSAALYMTVTRTLLRTVARQFTTPAEILSSVNELLLRDTPHGMYITAFLGILDQHTGELKYANAGHNLPICRHPNGILEKLLKGGMPLGIIEGLTLTNQSIRLAIGDTLVLYTDGVTEASTSIDFFGDIRLEAAIKDAGDQEPGTILDAIDRALVEFQESEIPSDDVTILAVHHCESKRK